METQEIEITEEDVIGLMDQFTKVPPFLLKMVVSGNSNVVNSFRGQIEDYKDTLSPEEMAKIKKVLEMPVDDLQEILKRAYLETKQEQLKILANPKAQPFIRKNLDELRKILF
jgi:D-arabinose 1-dehydrogenase-like Zn-dependent alcohol dehydrogenase